MNSVKLLLSNLLNCPILEPSIGLILRNNLSLCKIIFKHSEIRLKNDDISLFYKSIFGDNLKWTITYLKKSCNGEDLETNLEIVQRNYYYLLKQIGIDIFNIENENFSYNMSLPPQYDGLEALFRAYSKYEHFGLNTLILQDNRDFYGKFERIEKSINFSLRGIIFCLILLKIKDIELIEKLKNFHLLLE